MRVEWRPQIQLPTTKERVERLENLPFADVWSVTPKTIDVMVHRNDVRTVDPENVGRIVVGNVQEHIDAHAPRARKYAGPPDSRRR